MAIILLMVGMGAYVFTAGTGFAAALSSSSSQVSNNVSGARQLAVSNNCRTRFIVLTNNAENKEDWRLRTYGVLKEQPSAVVGGAPQFALVTQLDRLPTGIYFQRDYRDTEAAQSTQMIDRIATTRVQDVSNAEYAYIEFLPTGGTSSTGRENIFLIERGTDPGVSLPNDPNYSRLGVAQHTGRVRIERP